MPTVPPPPPMDPQGEPARSDDNFAQIAVGPPPWSKSAITGFVSSLLICIPVVPSLVGLIAGVMGISSTSGGSRRGRGLAIAAIPISLLTGAGWVIGFIVIAMFVRSSAEVIKTVERVFKARNLSDADLQEVIDSMMSDEAADSTSPAGIREWVERVVADKGSLAEVMVNVRFERVPGTSSIVFVIPCRFVNGITDVRVVMAVSSKGGRKYRIDDIEVGEHSLVDGP